MHLDMNAVLTLMSLTVCVCSRTSNWRPGKRYRQFMDWTWELPVRKRDPPPLPVSVRASSHFGLTNDCCPSVNELIQPRGGVSRAGRILELYRDGNATQSFYQKSCHVGFKGKPCRFIVRNRRFSRCVQQYSYTYALVREYNSLSPWRLDYIRVRSGCSCEVHLPTAAARRRPGMALQP